MANKIKTNNRPLLLIANYHENSSYYFIEILMLHGNYKYLLVKINYYFLGVKYSWAKNKYFNESKRFIERGFRFVVHSKKIPTFVRNTIQYVIHACNIRLKYKNVIVISIFNIVIDTVIQWWIICNKGELNIKNGTSFLDFDWVKKEEKGLTQISFENTILDSIDI